MYLQRLRVENFRLFGADGQALDLRLGKGLSVLVGPNDAGKSAVIDAIRYVLLTRDLEYIRVHQEDFHVDATGQAATQMEITCQFAGLTDDEAAAFLEYLTYPEGDDEAVLILTWRAKQTDPTGTSRRWLDVTLHTGQNGDGLPMDNVARRRLAATYLRPLRDADRELSSGRGSRLSQILSSFREVSEHGKSFDPGELPEDHDAVARLSLVGLADYLQYLVENHPGIGLAQRNINEEYLGRLAFEGAPLSGRIAFTQGSSPDARLRDILERLELSLLDGGVGEARGKYGLGSTNLLYVATELLLLQVAPDSYPILLLEEPEAHLHPQRQLRLMQFISESTASGGGDGAEPLQAIVTTHSPNLASKVPVENLILVEGARAFSLAQTQTELEPVDYRFLRRFLDVTKANLFFAHGVLIVEGPAEAIMLPVIADILNRSLTAHGVSIVNVGGTGLRRFSRIFQRANKDEQIGVRVACITDLDVMPDVAPAILGLEESPRRRWRRLSDLGANEEAQRAALAERIKTLSKYDGQAVKTYVSDHWTLEFDLARAGLPEEVFKAARLAQNDERIHDRTTTRDEVLEDAQAAFNALVDAYEDEAELASYVYAEIYGGKASKTTTAQYLRELLEEAVKADAAKRAILEACIPKYLRDAIIYVTESASGTANGSNLAPDVGDSAS